VKKVKNLIFCLIGVACIYSSPGAMAETAPVVTSVKNIFETAKTIVQTDYEYWLNGVAPGAFGFCVLVDENLDSAELFNDIGGKKFREASAEVKDHFTQAMRSEMANFIATIFAKFKASVAVDFKFLGETEGQYLVEVNVSGEDAFKSVLTLIQKEGTFKLVEVQVEAYQLIQTKKAELKTVIRNHGLKVVSDKLNRKNKNIRRGLFGLCD